MLIALCSRGSCQDILDLQIQIHPWLNFEGKGDIRKRFDPCGIPRVCSLLSPAFIPAWVVELECETTSTFPGFASTLFWEKSG